MLAASQHRFSRFVSHPSTIIVVVLLLVATLWSVLLMEQARNRQMVADDAWNEAANLTRAFEEHVVYTFNDVDMALRLLRNEWLQDRDRFERQIQSLQTMLDERLLVQIAVIGGDGRLQYSNLTPDVTPVDLSDREHFQIHRASGADRLFISKPVKGRVSGRYSIQMTRPIIAADGTFAGVLVISLSPDYFAKFFSSVDLGPNGSISLVGLDGVFRARGSHFRLDTDAIGVQLPADRPFLDPEAPALGSYDRVSAVDGVHRFVVYRRLEGFPMVVAVTNAVDDIFSAHDQRWLHYRWVAGAVSLLMLLGAGLLAHATWKQQRLRTRLLFTNDALKTLNEITGEKGSDTDNKLRKALELGCRHLGLEAGFVTRIHGQRCEITHCWSQPGMPMREGMAFDLEQSCCALTQAAGEVVAIPALPHKSTLPHAHCLQTLGLEAYMGAPVHVNELLYGNVNFSSATPRRQAFDDSDLEFIRVLARWIGTVIAEQRAMRELEVRATTDALTGVRSRGYFMTAMERELSRARRHGHRLSMLLIDLDHFKQVNDRYGHDAGDAVLREVARMGLETLRDSDLFARIGGEEFAALLPDAPQADAVRVCERLCAAIAALRVQHGQDELSITVSAGVAELEAGDDFAALYKRADQALYQAKHQGRNRVVASHDLELCRDSATVN